MAATFISPSVGSNHPLPVYTHELATFDEVLPLRPVRLPPFADAAVDWRTFLSAVTTYHGQHNSTLQHTLYLNFLVLFNAAHSSSSSLQERTERDQQVFDWIKATTGVSTRFLRRRLWAAFHLQQLHLRPVRERMEQNCFNFTDLGLVNFESGQGPDDFFQRLLVECDKVQSRSPPGKLTVADLRSLTIPQRAKHTRPPPADKRAPPPAPKRPRRRTRAAAVADDSDDAASSGADRHDDSVPLVKGPSGSEVQQDDSGPLDGSNAGDDDPAPPAGGDAEKDDDSAPLAGGDAVDDGPEEDDSAPPDRIINEVAGGAKGPYAPQDPSPPKPPRAARDLVVDVVGPGGGAVDILELPVEVRAQLFTPRHLRPNQERDDRQFARIVADTMIRRSGHLIDSPSPQPRTPPVNGAFEEAASAPSFREVLVDRFERINALPGTAKAPAGDRCSICQCNDRQDWVVLHWSSEVPHYFHRACLQSWWLRQSPREPPTCPLCKAPDADREARPAPSSTADRLKTALQLARVEIECLQKGRWLRDSILNATVAMLNYQRPGGHVYFLDPLPTERYSSYDRDIEAFQFVAKPLNPNGNHWTLAVWDKSSRVVYYLDSIASATSPAEQSVVRDFVNAFVDSPADVNIKPLRMARQRDSTSCGLFVHEAAVIVASEAWLNKRQRKQLLKDINTEDTRARLIDMLVDGVNHPVLEPPAKQAEPPVIDESGLETDDDHPEAAAHKANEEQQKLFRARSIACFTKNKEEREQLQDEVAGLKDDYAQAKLQELCIKLPVAYTNKADEYMSALLKNKDSGAVSEDNIVDGKRPRPPRAFQGDGESDSDSDSSGESVEVELAEDPPARPTAKHRKASASPSTPIEDLELVEEPPAWTPAKRRKPSRFEKMHGTRRRYVRRPRKASASPSTPSAQRRKGAEESPAKRRKASAKRRYPLRSSPSTTLSTISVDNIIPSAERRKGAEAYSRRCGNCGDTDRGKLDDWARCDYPKCKVWQHSLCHPALQGKNVKDVDWLCKKHAAVERSERQRQQLQAFLDAAEVAGLMTHAELTRICKSIVADTVKVTATTRQKIAEMLLLLSRTQDPATKATLAALAVQHGFPRGMLSLLTR